MKCRCNPELFIILNNIFSRCFILQVSVDGAIFFGRGTNTNYVSNQNSFPLGSGRKFAAPFWADVDTTNAGDVWYRQSTSQTMLDKANMQIRQAFPLQSPFTATNLIIATWDKVGYFDSKMDKVTFAETELAM